MTSARELVNQRLKEVFSPPVRRVLFVIPQEIPEADFRVEIARKQRYACFPPYGAGVVSQRLRERGYVSDILDLNMELLRSATTSRQFQYEGWREKLVSKLTAFQPECVGISCMFTMGQEQMLDIARLVKEFAARMPVIAGGVHPSNASEGVLGSSDCIDFVQMYEAEISFPNLLDCVNGVTEEASLTQVATLVDGTYVAVTDRALPQAEELDVAPLYHDLPIGEYDSFGQIGAYTFLRPGRKGSTVLANRGCRARCSFCSVRSFNGPGVRTRSIESVVDEMSHAVETHGVRHFMWLDDDLFYSHDRTLRLFNEIVKRNLDITWDATNGVIAAAITDEIMQAASESGCIGLAIGLESGDPDILRSVHKPGTVDSFRAAAEILRGYPHIFVRGFLIIGFPGETYGQLLRTVGLALELGFDWYPVQILNPLPSTEIYKTMIEQGLLEDDMRIGTVVAIGPAGKQRLIEERERLNAREFLDMFSVRDAGEVISKEELTDLWFLVDYKLNYEKILGMTDTIGLGLQRRMLTHVCDRLTIQNAMANLFLGVCEQKLGDSVQATGRAEEAERFVVDSAYWRNRFETLGLYEVLERVKSDASSSRSTSVG